jgi:predicted nucleic-acid-binding protein
MIGVDTNVLLRAIMSDDPRHSPRSRSFLAGRTADDPAVVNAVVLAELVWSLRAAYGMSRPAIAGILRDMVESRSYRFQNRTSVLRALYDYEAGTGAFTDRLIAEINDELGCRSTVTFDQHAQRHPPFAAVPA